MSWIDDAADRENRIAHSVPPCASCVIAVCEILVCTIVLCACLRVDAAPPDRKPNGRTNLKYLENDDLRIGIDLNLGGSITFLSAKRHGARRANIVNSYDLGRQIQMSYFSGPVPFLAGKHEPIPAWRHIGWNPIQSGDYHGHRSQVVGFRHQDDSLYVRCIPKHWPLADVAAECQFESWVKLDGPAVHVRCRLVNRRTDKTQFSARDQELPAVYLNAPFHRLFSYTGNKPCAGQPLTKIENDAQAAFPWARFRATEHWAALVDDDDFGLAVYQPDCPQFLGGFVGAHGQGDSADASTGYLAPTRREIIDHNITHEYTYSLIVGKLPELRRWAVTREAKRKLPAWTFAENRQGWYYANATDTGWPIRQMLDVRLTGNDPQLHSPPSVWQAEKAPLVRIEAAFENCEATAQIFWNTLAPPHTSADFRVDFPIVSDGSMRVYEVDLSQNKNYRNAVTSLRIDPVSRGGPEKGVRLKSVELIERR